jgi:glycosyltransferase involved in cell wall biosynthesis
MKLLTLSTLYPNAASTAQGVFVETRLCEWVRRSGGEAKVIAPVPWFPFAHPIFGKYARFAAAPARETRRGVEVRHPRYVIPPKIGMTYAASALARIFEREARAVIADGFEFDLIDAHYLYPDGVAAARAAMAMGKPFVLTARGSDVTLLATYPRQRAMILDAIRKADGVIAVAESLKDELIRIGAPAEKIRVLRNGVDLEMFRPLDRDAIRERLALKGAVIASVGGLIPRKGHDIVIEAIAQMPETTLLVVGAGPERARLQSRARRLGVIERVRFLGEWAHDRLPEIYNAADALVLASTREGWPNVLLEAMACGAPAVASDAGGNREVIASPDAGRIVDHRTPAAFAAALSAVLGGADRAATRRFAEAYAWDETSDALSTLFNSVKSRSDLAASLPVTAAMTAKAAKPRLIVTVDTEEIFDWRGFSPTDYKVAQPADIDRFQSVCEQFGARAIYFLTYPVLTDAENAGYFRRLVEEGRADLGVHLHQWVTPPLRGYAGEYYSWQCNLPPEAHAEKLATLCVAFERAFGFKPRAHRAGRYGVSPLAYRELAAAGLDLDFSPSPGFDFSGNGGPDFSSASNAPFHIATDRGGVFVTPVCGALAIRGGRAFLKQPATPGLFNARAKVSRRLTAPFRLSCEQARLEELAALTRSLAATDAPILTFSLHSTTMTPGANPYGSDAESVAAALDLARRYFEFFTKSFGGAFAGLSDLMDLYRPQD